MQARLGFGQGGHELEWVLGLEGYDHNNYIPGNDRDAWSIPGKLHLALGDFFHVSNRGTRIEIMARDLQSHDGIVIPAVRRILREFGEYQIDIANHSKSGLNTDLATNVARLVERRASGVS